MKWIGFLALIAGLILFFFTDSLNFNSAHGPISGVIEMSSGDVLGKGHTDSFYKPLSKGHELSPQYKILTSFDSSAVINYGENFTLKANSLVRLEQKGRHFSVHLISGNLSREKIGSTSFYVNGKSVSSQDIETSGVTQLSQVPIDEVSVRAENPEQTPNATNKKQIYQTFKLHQRFIEKCFIKHYSRKEGQTSSGKVWVRFTVTKKGSLEDPSIHKSDYSDQEFHRCLKEVVSRVQLKNYSGPSMQIKFPINIELPE